MSVKGTINKFSGTTLPYAFIRNEGRTVEVGGNATRPTPNSLYDPWTLDGWEIRSPSTILTDSKGKRTMGYVCDEAGITVSFTREIKSKETGEISPGDVSLNECIKNPLQVFMSASEQIDWRVTAKKYPALYLKENGTTLEWGGYIRGNDKILTNGPGEPVYRIMSAQTEIVNKATGKSELGYICDESGQTVEIGRDITILHPDPLPGQPLPAQGSKLPEPDKVNITIKFCAAVGKVCSFDRIPDIFDVGQSKRNFWMGLGAGLFAMFVVTRLF